MAIEGLGERLIEQLVEAKIVSHFADLFRLPREVIANLESPSVTKTGKISMRRIGEKTVDAIIASANEARGRGLARVLASLGIRHLGTSASKTLARKYPDSDALMAATTQDLEALDDIGEITAAALARDFSDPAMRETFRRLAECGVDMKSKEYRLVSAGSAVADDSDPFRGKTIVLTGTLASFDRRALTELLEQRGAKISGSVSAKTHILIAGTEAGSKLSRAQELGVEVWDEARLRATLDSSSQS
jgi:DNA ligase (NAD+)